MKKKIICKQGSDQSQPDITIHQRPFGRSFRKAPYKLEIAYFQKKKKRNSIFYGHYPVNSNEASDTAI